MESRIKFIDIAKGIGILLVVIGHTPNGGDTIKPIIYSFHMPLFFILAGMVMKVSESQLCSRRKNINKLLYQYCFYSILYVLFDIFVRCLLLRNQGMERIFWDFYYTISFWGINVLWFLTTLIMARYFIEVSMSYIKFQGLRFLLITFICLLIVMQSSIFINNYLQENKALLLIYYPIASLFRAISMCFYIVVGMKCRIFLQKWQNQTNNWKLLLGGLVLMFPNCMFSQSLGLVDVHLLCFGNEILFIMLSLTGSFSIIFFSCFLSKLPQLSSVFGFWGENSLFIMATHTYFMIVQVSGFIVKIVIPEGEIRFWICVFITMIIEMILCKFLAPSVNKLIQLLCDYKK